MRLATPLELFQLVREIEHGPELVRAEVLDAGQVPALERLWQVRADSAIAVTRQAPRLG